MKISIFMIALKIQPIMPIIWIWKTYQVSIWETSFEIIIAYFKNNYPQRHFLEIFTKFE